MNETNPVKSCMTKAKPLAVIRIICAVLTLVPIILVIAAENKINVSYLSDIYGAKGAMYIGYMIFYCMPLLALIVMGIIWTVSFIRASKPGEDGAALRSSSVASLATSILGFFACLATLLFSAASLKAMGKSYGGGIASAKTIMIFFLIFSIAGVVSLPLTSIARAVFYKNVHKSLGSDAPQTGGAGFYAVMKIINAVIRAAMGVILLINMIDTLDRTNGRMDAVNLIFFIVCILALFVGVVACIMEARFVLGCKKAVSAPAQSAYPTAAPGYAPAPGYSAPSYTQPRYPQPPYQQPAYPQPQEPAAPQTRFCPNCGSPNTDGDLFCQNCGTRL